MQREKRRTTMRHGGDNHWDDWFWTFCRFQIPDSINVRVQHRLCSVENGGAVEMVTVTFNPNIRVLDPRSFFA